MNDKFWRSNPHLQPSIELSKDCTQLSSIDSRKTPFDMASTDGKAAGSPDLRYLTPDTADSPARKPIIKHESIIKHDSFVSAASPTSSTNTSVDCDATFQTHSPARNDARATQARSGYQFFPVEIAALTASTAQAEPPKSAFEPKSTEPPISLPAHSSVPWYALHGVATPTTPTRYLPPSISGTTTPQLRSPFTGTPPTAPPLSSRVPADPCTYTVPGFNTKPATLAFGPSDLRGVLILISQQDWLVEPFARFLDILPLGPCFLESLEPLVLLHAIHGKSWMNALGFETLPESLSWALSKLRDHNDFIALVADPKVFHTVQKHLGACDLAGTFKNTMGYDEKTLDAIILALPTDRPMPMPTRVQLSSRSIDAKTYPPLPVSPELLTLIGKLQHSFANDSGSRNTSHGLNRLWLKTFHPGLLAKNPEQRTALLDETHPLWALRGNVYIFDWRVWRDLCFPKGTKVGEMGSLEAHWQEVFVDPQLRGRRRDGWKFADVEEKYYQEFGHPPGVSNQELAGLVAALSKESEV